MIHFFDLNPDSLIEYCAVGEMPKFIGAQLLDWVYQKGVVDPALMTNIAAGHRAVLAKSMDLYCGQVVRHQLAPMPCLTMMKLGPPKTPICSWLVAGIIQRACTCTPVSCRKTDCEPVTVRGWLKKNG